jgi:hypothetical protein
MREWPRSRELQVDARRPSHREASLTASPDTVAPKVVPEPNGLPAGRQPLASLRIRSLMLSPIRRRTLGLF